MPFLIGEACVDVMDKSCMKVCPVDCIYTGDRKLYINPAECIDCAACEAECPVEAIYIDDDVPDEEQWAIEDNAQFFTTTLPGREEPLGNLGGSRNIGRIGVDTVRIAALPVKEGN